MAQAYRETTQWEDGNAAINHTYLLEGDMMIAYMRVGSNVPYYFKNPIRISKSGRKFEPLELNPFDSIFSVIIPQTVEGRVREIDGSKGAKYILDIDAKTCTCPGYTYRGACRHVKELETV